MPGRTRADDDRASESTTRPQAPRMPAEAELSPAWRERLHHFHLTGERPAEGAESGAPPPPVAAARLLDDRSRFPDFPLWLVDDVAPDGEIVRSLASVVNEAARSVERDGRPLVMLANQVPRLCGLARRRLAARPDGAPARAVLEGAFADLAATFDVSPAGAAALDGEIEALGAAIELEGRLLAADDRGLALVFSALVRRDVRTARRAAAEEIGRLRARLRALLRADERAAGDRGGLDSELGRIGSAFLDAQKLARSLSEVRGTPRMPGARRERIERALADLDSFPADDSAELLVVSRGEPLGFEAGEGVSVVRCGEPLGEATRRFDDVAAELVRGMRALRVARLEVEHAYEPELHDPILRRLDWAGLSAAELRLLPCVTVVADGALLRGEGFGGFSELLRSGRPVRVLAVERAPTGEADPAADRVHPGLGYLAVAHREAFVVQGSLGRPDSLVADLTSMIASVSPGVAFVALPPSTGELPAATALEAGLAGRATPCYRYDPARGTSWAERFLLRGNPESFEAWPTVEWACRDHDDDDGPRTHREAFTFAHAACLDPGWQAHFLVLPSDAGSDDFLIEVADWLAREPDVRRRSHPFVWVVRDGELARAVITRALAFACRDRMRAWRIFQELGGERNEHARRAAAEAREAAAVEFADERRRLEEQHARALEQARREGATQAVDRLVGVLTAPGGAEAASAAAEPVSPSPTGASASEGAATDAPVAAPPDEPKGENTADRADDQAAEAPPTDDDELSFDEPFIDSFLCTSCNDCINLNPRMFRYNANKQAELADPTAGSYEQLVQAAEKCPARCIHPGKPRADDPTATPELIARGAAL